MLSLEDRAEMTMESDPATPSQKDKKKEPSQIMDFPSERDENQNQQETVQSSPEKEEEEDQDQSPLLDYKSEFGGAKGGHGHTAESFSEKQEKKDETLGFF